MKRMVIEFILFFVLLQNPVHYFQSIVRSYHIGFISLIVGVHRCKQTMFNWHFFLHIDFLVRLIEWWDTVFLRTNRIYFMWLVARDDHSKSKAKPEASDSMASSWKKLNARLVEFHTKYRRCTVQCSHKVLATKSAKN